MGYTPIEQQTLLNLVNCVLMSQRSYSKIPTTNSRDRV